MKKGAPLGRPLPPSGESTAADARAAMRPAYWLVSSEMCS